MIQQRRTYQMLIADDDVSFRETLCLIFDPYFDLLEADSGEEALEIVEAEAVHLALLDMHMHLLTGLQTLKLLKSRDADMPCILITSEATDRLREEAVRADAFDVLSKPVAKQELCETVAQAMSRAYDEPFPLS